MRRLRKILAFLSLGLVLVVVLAACAWLYITLNVEQPVYRVIRSEGPIEQRAYPDLIAAEVETQGSRHDGVRTGFRPLARYIFARERPGEKIAMTAPVVQRATGNGWVIQFIMPSEYALKDLPRPASSDVRLTRIPARERAVIRFSGIATDERIAEHQDTLTAWMLDQGLRADGPPIYAYYNDPLTPGFLRRNEVIFDLGHQ